MLSEYSVTNDTSNNYDVVENVIQDFELSGFEVLLAFSNIFGLQLFTEEATHDLLKEFGAEEY